MTHEIIRDESGKVTDIKVNGKSVAKSFVRGWNKAEKTPYFHLFKDHPDYLAMNPYSGVTVTLNQLEYTIYAFCFNWYQRYSANVPSHAPIQAYDDMKYFLLELNSQAYMDLLD